MGTIFELEVANFYRLGMSKGEAIRAATEKEPEAHAQYLQRVNNDGKNFLPDVWKAGRKVQFLKEQLGQDR